MKEIFIDAGSDVLCDRCCKDYSESEEKGGFLIRTYAICPTCAPDFRKDVERNGEQSEISECPEGMSFREWVLSIR